MNTLKNAAKDFIHRDGHHDTEAREEFRPAIEQETVKPVEFEKQTTALDREVHQHHYQTRIQPIRDQVEAPEHHVQNVLPVEEKVVREGNPADVERQLAQERQGFKDTRTTLPTVHHTAGAGVVAGEHVHHHVHESIQPVIQREVLQPTVIHTTIPVHERVEKAAQVHPPTVQPTMTLEEFERKGGHLKGVPETLVQRYEGCPAVRENGGADRTKPDHLAGTAKGAVGTGTVGAGAGVGAGVAAAAAGMHRGRHHNDKPSVLRRGTSRSSSSSSSSSDEEGTTGHRKGHYKHRTGVGAGMAGAAAGTAAARSGNNTTGVTNTNPNVPTDAHKPRSMIDDALGTQPGGARNVDPRHANRDGTTAHGQDGLPVVRDQAYGTRT